MKILSCLFFLFLISCKAQVPEFALAGNISEDATTEEYVAWYNKTVVSPKYDTVSVFKMPEFSNIRYVIIRPISGVARIEYTNGRFIGWLSKESIWIESLKFDAKGNVVQGMRPVMISALKDKGLIVQYELCENCNFKKSAGNL